MNYTSALCLISSSIDEESTDGETTEPKPFPPITDLKGPCSCAMTKDSMVVVCEWRGHCVSVIDADGDPLVRFGNRFPSEDSLRQFRGIFRSPSFKSSSQLFGSKDGELHEPTGVAVTSDDNIAVCDSQNNRVQLFKTSGVHLLSTQRTLDDRDKLAHPYDIAINKRSGLMYVSHPFNQTISVLSPELAFSRNITLKGEWSRTFTPLGLAFDSNNILYVCDRDNSQVYKLSPEGEPITVYKTDHLIYPTRVAVDANGIVYVSYSYSSEIAMYSNDGAYIGRFGGGCPTVSQLRRPRGIMLARGNIYVCDTSNNEVVIF